MTVDIEWTYAFQDGEYPEWTLVVVTEGMKGLLRTAAAQNLSIDPESLRIQAHTRQQIKKSTGKASVAAAELRISVEAEPMEERPGLEPLDSFEDEHFNMDTPATMGEMRCPVESYGSRCRFHKGHGGDHELTANPVRS